jgi:hypothetical protein
MRDGTITRSFTAGSCGEGRRGGGGIGRFGRSVTRWVLCLGLLFRLDKRNFEVFFFFFFFFFGKGRWFWLGIGSGRFVLFCFFVFALEFPLF